MLKLTFPWYVVELLTIIGSADSQAENDGIRNMDLQDKTKPYTPMTGS
ncbi:hypothetical protein ACE1ET_04455 [Saccharicrinis sp. FJH62]